MRRSKTPPPPPPGKSTTVVMRRSEPHHRKDVEEEEGDEAATKMVLRTMAAVVLLLSLAPHKELRFALPLVGLANAVSARSVSNFFEAQTTVPSSPSVLVVSDSGSPPTTAAAAAPSPKRRRRLRYIVLLVYLALNAAPALYLSLVHQRWPVDVSFFVSRQCENTRCLVDVLLPCHATPLYSHMDPNTPRHNLTISFVDCSPYSVLGKDALSGFKKVAPPFPIALEAAKEGEKYAHDREWFERDPSGFIGARYAGSRCRGEPFDRLLVLTSSAHFPLVWGALPGKTVFRHLATYNFNDIPARVANRYLPDKWKKDDVKVLVYECRV